MMERSRIAFDIEEKDCVGMSGSQVIRTMADFTDETGTLYTGECWMNDPGIRKCKMTWNRENAARLELEYEDLRDSLRELAEKVSYLLPEKEYEEEVKRLPNDLRGIYEKFIRDTDFGDLDLDLINGIEDRYESIECAEAIKAQIERGENVSKEDLDFYEKIRDICVSDDEEALYNEYMRRFTADAEQRLGAGTDALVLMNQARRCYRLYSMQAPQIIIENEERALAFSLAVHKYCASWEIVEEGNT